MRCTFSDPRRCNWRQEMRRMISGMLAAAMVALASGCIAVSSHRNRFDLGSEVVAVNDRVYIVNKRTGRVCEVDLSRAVPSEQVIWDEEDDD